MKRPASKVIALFGLSADPPTGRGGHVGIVLWCANHLQITALPGSPRVDEVWVSPVFRHVFSEKQAMTPYTHRLAMTRLAFDALDRARVPIRIVEADREAFEALPNDEAQHMGTVDVLHHLKRRHPHVHFVLVLGADSYADLCSGRWKDPDGVRHLATIIDLPRRGVTSSASEQPIELRDVSSTKMRNSRNLAYLQRELPQAVLDYILEHHLYAIGKETFL